ncbi:hypothetical protein SBA6_500037 [Candidatus Sulfopaludibacter sp. SbA6]|nr:hypothetical protein SBA6_500037 [Candidatus Sulfopaludibacter sp. SbA6]
MIMANQLRGGTQNYGAGDRIRTGDIDLGKVALYQLSYSRPAENTIFLQKQDRCQTLWGSR